MQQRVTRPPALVKLLRKCAGKGKTDAKAFRVGVQRAMAKSMAQAHGCAKVKVLPMTLIEAPAGSSSALAAEVGRLGGASLRVCKPEGESTREQPPPVPSIRIGNAATWRLDLHRRQHRRVFMAFLKKVRMVLGTKRLHFHSSPQCAKVSSLQNLRKLGRPRRVHRSALQVARNAHRAFAKNASKDEEKSASHEQPRGARAGRLGKWPWAIRPWSKRVALNGCMCGLCGDVGDGCGTLPVCKAWCFECQRDDALKALLPLRCPRGHPRNYVIGEAGRKGVGGAATECYPPAGGLALAMAFSPVEEQT